MIFCVGAQPRVLKLRGSVFLVLSDEAKEILQVRCQISLAIDHLLFRSPCAAAEGANVHGAV
jgi:hypothetical protein